MRLGAPLLAFAMVAAASAAPADTVNGWSERGVFAFDGGLVLDFQKKEAVYGPVGYALHDCSTPDDFCARSDVFALALPRRCSDMAKGTWTVGDVTTSVIATVADPGASTSLHPWGSETLQYLVTSGHPNVLYVYDHYFGVKEIRWDIDHKNDFAAMARDGTLSPVYPPPRGEHIARLAILTLDNFGRCDPDK